MVSPRRDCNTTHHSLSLDVHCCFYTVSSSSLAHVVQAPPLSPRIEVKCLRSPAKWLELVQLEGFQGHHQPSQAHNVDRESTLRSAKSDVDTPAFACPCGNSLGGFLAHVSGKLVVPPLRQPTSAQLWDNRKKFHPSSSTANDHGGSQRRKSSPLMSLSLAQRVTR